MREAKKMVSVLWIKGNAETYHYFDLPSCGMPDFYRATTSYNAFRDREANRLNKQVEVHGNYELDKRCHLDYVSDMMWLDKNRPAFYHDSIWTMYKAVGYDYKKQRYI